MRYALKIVLHSPLSDPAVLDQFVEDCLRDKVALISVVGEGCEEIEELIDELVVGDGSDADRFIMTTSHKSESVATVLEFAEAWQTDVPGFVQEVRL
jgi:hypothetical protein